MYVHQNMTESHNQCQNPMISPHGYKSTKIKQCNKEFSCKLHKYIWSLDGDMNQCVLRHVLLHECTSLKWPARAIWLKSNGLYK